MHVIGTAGHVDHGKSTLVKALTGMDPDRFAEEQERGLTIDLGFAWLTLPSGREIGIVDVPGHERFIRNMLAGVGGIDAALFVVAADEGWRPQSAEHLAILDFLQVRAGVVALTKTDAVDEDVRAVASEEVSEKLRGTTLAGAPVVPVSGLTGAGLEDLLHALDGILEGIGEPADRGRPRLFVDRSFTIAGAGTVVTGTLTGGCIRVGEEVELVPTGERARVRSLQTHKRPVDEAVPGSRVAANLVGLDRHDVGRGDAVVRPGTWPASDTFAARVRTAPDLDHGITEKGAYELYVGSAEVPCRMKFLEDPPDSQGRIPSLRGELLVQMFCMRALPLDVGDRFIVRDVGRWRTVAGGVVLDHFPGRVRRNDPQVLERLRLRESSAREDLVAQLLAERGVLERSSVQWLAGLGPLDAEAALASVVAGGRGTALPSAVVAVEHAAALRSRALETLSAHHAAHPLEPGMPREALRAALRLEPRLFNELVEHWSADVVPDGAVVRLPSHGLRLSRDEEAAAAHAIQALRAGGSSPPDVGELGIGQELLKALVRRGDVVVVAPGIAYESGVLRDIEQRIVELIARGPATVAQARDAIGTSRKYAVPLLEYLDSTGLTRRQGDTRVLGPRGRAGAEPS